MGNFETDPFRQILQDEILRIMEDAAKDEHIIHSGREAVRLASLYPDCGLTADDICDQLIEAAIHAGVTIEMSRPDNSTSSAPTG